MRKLKILQINESHFEAGGQERYFFDLINALREEGYEVYSFGFASKPKRTKRFKNVRKFWGRYEFNFN